MSNMELEMKILNVDEDELAQKIISLGMYIPQINIYMFMI